MSKTKPVADSETSVLERVTLDRPSGDTARSRSCMACGQPFLSEGWHNRLCPRCRKRSEPDGW